MKPFVEEKMLNNSSSDSSVALQFVSDSLQHLDQTSQLRAKHNAALRASV